MAANPAAQTRHAALFKFTPIFRWVTRTIGFHPVRGDVYSAGIFREGPRLDASCRKTLGERRYHRARRGISTVQAKAILRLSFRADQCILTEGVRRIEDALLERLCDVA